MIRTCTCSYLIFRQLPEITHRVYLNIEIEGEPHHSGQVVLGLFGGIAPKAVENFRSLCACDKGNGQLSDKPLCYKGTEFHRISECFLVVFFEEGASRTRVHRLV